MTPGPSLVTSNARGVNCQFSIGSVMLLTAWLALALGLSRLVLPAGVLFVCASAPALVTTWQFVARRKRLGQAVDAPSVVRTFARSLGTVLLAAAASVLLFFAACLAACLFGVTAAISCCRSATPRVKRLRGAAARLLIRAADTTASLARCSGRMVARRRSLLVRMPAAIAPAVCAGMSFCCSAVLLGVLTTVSICQLSLDWLGKSRAPVQWMRDGIVKVTTQLMNADGQLLRTLRATPP